ncbi:MAG: Wzz/FepE/Etk N-terminal domain-containing protein, partial [Actinomycetota bacterium]|nr:Wzz/FepE/Etk N-terminal domain-containing protein [Actinomycetota bacterium]
MSLRDYLSVIRRRMWTIALVAVLVAGAAAAYSSIQTPVYEARTRLLLGANQSSVDNGGYGQYIDSNSVQTELQVIIGKPVADLVKAQLGSVPGISGTAVGGTAVIELTARSLRAADAVTIANAYASAYITYRQQQFADTVSVQTKEYTRQISALSDQIASLNAQPRAANAPAPPELATLLAQQAAFQIKLGQVDSAQRLNGNGAAVIAPAVPASAPVSPTPVRNVALGLFVGLVLGVGAALLFEHLDDSVTTKEDIERVAPQLSVLGVIPLVPNWRNRAQARLVASAEPSSPAAEAYRALRTSIQFLGLERSLRVLQVTSPIASEGKSTTLANLAVTLAQAGLRVIVVCCDLRRPRIHDFFGLSNDVGFTSVLLGQVPLTGALQSVPDMPRVKLLASGPLPPNPSELLSSRRTADVLAQLGSQADIVL